jgi:hypothetical protein
MLILFMAIRLRIGKLSGCITILRGGVILESGQESIYCGGEYDQAA